MLIGGEESGGISFKGHIPEGDGILMGLLMVEMVAAYGDHACDELVNDLLQEVGPAFYERTDLRLKRPVSKAAMTDAAGQRTARRDWRRERQRNRQHRWGQVHHGR